MNLNKLRALQIELARKVSLEDKYSIDEIKYVIGVDQAFLGDYIISAAVKFKFPSIAEVGRVYTIEKVSFPYIPSFLMFREGDPAVSVVKKLIEPNTVVLVDGSGIAHPRKCGLATYIALKVGEPSVGITKKKLFGEIKAEDGLLKLKDEDETIGFVLKTCKRCKPIYISPGSFISPKTALLVVKECLRGHKLPEPIRQAHIFANEVKKNIDKQNIMLDDP